MIPKTRNAVNEEKSSSPTGVKYCKDSLKAVLIVDQAIIDAPAYRYALFCFCI